MKKLNLILGILIGLTLFSCSNDDDNDDFQVSEHELVGTWLYITSNDNLESRLTFNSDQTGDHYYRDGTFENSDDITWTTENNVLTLAFISGNTNSESYDYDINSDGQLIFYLNNDAELTYNKVE